VVQILSFRRLSRVPSRSALRLTSGLGLALLVCIPFASAQTAPVGPRKQPAAQPLTWSVCDSASAGITITDSNGLVYTCGDTENGPGDAKKDKQVAPVSATAAPGPVNPVSSPVPPAPAQGRVGTPVISWDGKQLTIDAENSTLSDILLGVRARTGASIDMPPSTAAEQVAVHLGPAPIREVLSSLLYGTDFDYIIQGSDTDEGGLRSVTLTQRESSDVVTASDAAGKSRIRLMPGYSAPGKRDFEVAAEAAADSSASPSAESTTADAGAPASQEPASAGADPASTIAKGPSADSQPSPAESADAILPAGNEPLNRTAVSSSSQPNSSEMPSTSMSQMQQNLQHMYQQRQQIQAQQTQNPQPPGK
jgi:hypothetical protein